MEKFQKAIELKCSLQQANEAGLAEGWVAYRQTYSQTTKGWYCPKGRKGNGDFRAIKPLTEKAKRAVVHPSHGWRWSIWRVRSILEGVKLQDGKPKYQLTNVQKKTTKNYIYYFFYAREIEATKVFSV